MKFIISVSLILNGLLGGLIAGHLMTKAEPAVCRCDRRRGDDERPLDRGPFPTGWVVPEESPTKPSKPAGEFK